jgi:circadian clock protein KaiC
VVYFSTLSEPMDKIVRFGQTLDFSTPPLSASQSSMKTWRRAASNSGLAGVGEQVADTLKKRHPGLVIIDSFKPCSRSRTAARITGGSSTSSPGG